MLKDFKCNRCGLCCHSPRLYKEDIKNIIKAGHKEQDFLITDFRGVTYIKEKNGWCTFLKKENPSHPARSTKQDQKYAFNTQQNS